MFDILCLDILDIYAINSFRGGGGRPVIFQEKTNKENNSIIHRLIKCGG